MTTLATTHKVGRTTNRTVSGPLNRKLKRAVLNRLVGASTPSSCRMAEQLEADDLDYRDLEPLLAQLREMPADSAERDWLYNRVIAACLPLAKHVAQRFVGRGESLDDLEQVARVGLVQAINRFDPTHGAAFLSFAVPTMMGEVRRHFRDRSWSVYVPRTAKENYLRVGPAAEDLTNRLGRSPTVSELAEELGLSHDAVTDAILAGYAYTPDSIDSRTSSSEDDRPLAENLAVEDSSYDHVDDFLTVKPLIEKLPPEDRAVLKMRFFDNMTQSQIAERIGRSQMHVSRALARILTALREQADV